MSATYKEQRQHLSDRWRSNISNSNILTRLIKFAEGHIDMTPAQANTGLRLIGKILPDRDSIRT